MTPTKIAPAAVHETLARHMLADGYDMVLDLEKNLTVDADEDEISEQLKYQQRRHRNVVNLELTFNDEEDATVSYTLGFQEEERGANAWLVIPRDDGVFDGVTERRGVPCAAPVQVFLDGIPFVAPATIKNGKKVTQPGTLLTGETIGAYLSAHDNRAVVTIRNSNGTLATFGYVR